MNSTLPHNHHHHIYSNVGRLLRTLTPCTLYKIWLSFNTNFPDRPLTFLSTGSTSEKYYVPFPGQLRSGAGTERTLICVFLARTSYILILFQSTNCVHSEAARDQQTLSSISSHNLKSTNYAYATFDSIPCFWEFTSTTTTTSTGYIQ